MQIKSVVDVVLPTVEEAVSWIKRMSYDKHYCLQCIKLWREIGGKHFADSVLARSPDDVIEFVERIGGRIEA